MFQLPSYNSESHKERTATSQKAHNLAEKSGVPIAYEGDITSTESLPNQASKKPNVQIHTWNSPDDPENPYASGACHLGTRLTVFA